MLDKNLLLDEDRAVTAAATYTSDTLALAVTGSDKRERRGAGFELLVQITESFAAGGGTAVDFRATSGNTSALGSPQTQYSSGAVAAAALTLGRKFRFPVNFLIPDADATHFGLLAVSTGTFTLGKYTATIQPVGTDQDAA